MSITPAIVNYYIDLEKLSEDVNKTQGKESGYFIFEETYDRKPEIYTDATGETHINYKVDTENWDTVKLAFKPNVGESMFIFLRNVVTKVRDREELTGIYHLTLAADISKIYHYGYPMKEKIDEYADDPDNFYIQVELTNFMIIDDPNSTAFSGKSIDLLEKLVEDHNSRIRFEHRQRLAKETLATTET